MTAQGIASHGMLMQLLRLLRPGDKEGRGFDLSTGTYTQVIKTLAMCVEGGREGWREGKGRRGGREGEGGKGPFATLCASFAGCRIRI